MEYNVRACTVGNTSSGWACGSIVANVTAQLLTTQLQFIDNTGNVQRLSTLLPTIAAQVGAGQYQDYLLLGVGNTNLVLPAATVWFAYFRNLHASQNVNIVMTPAGGSAWVSPLVLAPGAAFVYAAPYTSNPAAGGVTAITLSASGASTPVELAIAA